MTLPKKQKKAQFVKFRVGKLFDLYPVADTVTQMKGTFPSFLLIYLPLADIMCFLSKYK